MLWRKQEWPKLSLNAGCHYILACHHKRVQLNTEASIANPPGAVSSSMSASEEKIKVLGFLGWGTYYMSRRLCLLGHCISNIPRPCILYMFSFFICISYHVNHILLIKYDQVVAGRFSSRIQWIQEFAVTKSDNWIRAVGGRNQHTTIFSSLETMLRGSTRHGWDQRNLSAFKKSSNNDGEVDWIATTQCHTKLSPLSGPNTKLDEVDSCVEYGECIMVHGKWGRLLNFLMSLSRFVAGWVS